MSKQIKLGAEARKKLFKGIDTLADAVVSSLVYPSLKTYPS